MEPDLGGSQNEGALGIALDGNIAYVAGKTLSFGNGKDEAVLLKVYTQTGEFPRISEQLP